MGAGDSGRAGTTSFGSALADSAARETGLAAGEQVQALRRETFFGAATCRGRPGHFVDLKRAQGLGRRDFGSGADVEVEFRC